MLPSEQLALYSIATAHSAGPCYKLNVVNYMLKNVYMELSGFILWVCWAAFGVFWAYLGASLGYVGAVL